MPKVNLKKNEKIIRIVHRYGLTFFWWWSAIAILLGVPFFFMFWLFRHGWWGQALFTIPIVIGIIFLIRVIYLWKRNVFLITTHRLIDTEQRGIFDQLVSEVMYDQLEDVNGRVKGICGTIFRYGTISVQTGNGQVRLTVEKIKRPLQLQQDINKLREEYLLKHAFNFSGNVAEAIIDKLYELELKELFRVLKTLKKRINKLQED